MNYIDDDIERRETELTEKLKSINARIRHCPEGKLSTRIVRGRIQYFHRKNPGDKRGRYIPKKEMNLIRALAQKDYDTATLTAIKREMKAIESWKKSCPKTRAEDVFKQLSSQRKELVVPEFQTEEMYAKRWLAQAKKSEPFMSDSLRITTLRGDSVRSKAEAMIADALFNHGIPYKYEQSVWAFETVYLPDFIILQPHTHKEMIWEHFGMMDDKAYADNVMKKLSNYAQAGFVTGDNLLFTMETQSNPLSNIQINRMIERSILSHDRS